MILGSRIRIALTGSLALAALLVPAGSSASAGSGVASYHATQDPQAVIDYWTPERMRKAEPMDFPAAPAAFSDGPLESAPLDRGAPTVIPPTIPADAGSYSVGSDFETDPAGDTVFPQRIHGKIFATLPQGNYSCSGTVVTSPKANLVVTAGHCVFGQGVFATNFVFVPGYRNGNTPLGLWPAAALYAPAGWTGGPAFDSDLGMVRTAPISGVLIQNFLGARGIAFNLSLSQRFDIIGYPARPNPGQDGFGDYDGERLIFCDDSNASAQGLESAPNEESVGAAYCFMQQGSSGGGWVIVGGIVNSVVSHGYCQNRPGFPGDPNPHVYPNGPCGIMFGPYFGIEEQNLYNAATLDPPPEGKKCKKKKKKKNRSAAAAKKKKKKKCKKKKK